MTQNIHNEKILILDFGSQYTQLIARRVRELGVYCEIHPYHISAETIVKFAPKGVILSGGPQSVAAIDTPRAPDVVFTLGCPVLGICYGLQTMAAQFGGDVKPALHCEFGHALVTLQSCQLFEGLDLPAEKQLSVWMSHGDRVETLPPEFKVIASTSSAPLAGIANESKRFYAIQFHPEVTHTTQGTAILGNFVKHICACHGLWTPSSILEDRIEAIRAQVGHDQVILGLSGGVDSSVVAALLHQAIGDQLICVFVDTGLLRLNEVDKVLAVMEKSMNIHVVHVNAAQQFLSALKGESDPEAKRKIIGKEFIDVFAEEAKKHPNVKWLAQGTIYSDVIESAAHSGQSQVIKSHHNVGGLPDKLPLKLLEPLRELFKDEVRTLGLEAGLPHGLSTSISWSWFRC